MGVRPNPLEHGRYWDRTENPAASGCHFADYSCVNCYAITYAAGVHAKNDIDLYRGTTKPNKHGWSGRLSYKPLNDPAYTIPLTWPGAKEPVMGPGKPSIFWANSMADLFDPLRVKDARAMGAIDYFLTNIAISPHNIIGLVLTKHPAQMVEYFSTKPAWWRKRFILVFSASDQRWWDRRWELIRPLAEQGWIIGTSIQPMLGPVVVAPDFRRLGRWVICGGEQPPGYREMKLDWALSLRDQCKAAGLPFFVKQMTTGRLPRACGTENSRRSDGAHRAQQGCWSMRRNAVDANHQKV
jgi:protein gp37